MNERDLHTWEQLVLHRTGRLNAACHPVSIVAYEGLHH